MPFKNVFLVHEWLLFSLQMMTLVLPTIGEFRAKAIYYFGEEEREDKTPLCHAVCNQDVSSDYKNLEDKSCERKTYVCFYSAEERSRRAEVAG